MKPMVRQIYELLLSVPLGAIGGGLCGAVILSANVLIGPPWAGPEFTVHWEPYFLGLGATFGGYIGIVVAPIGYLLFLRSIGLRKAIFPAFIGTLVGGGIGALGKPGAAICAGVFGFFLSLGGLWLVNKRRGCQGEHD
jgi:hypothetical protein